MADDAVSLPLLHTLQSPALPAAVDATTLLQRQQTQWRPPSSDDEDSIP